MMELLLSKFSLQRHRFFWLTAGFVVPFTAVLIICLNIDSVSRYEIKQKGIEMGFQEQAEASDQWTLLHDSIPRALSWALPAGLAGLCVGNFCLLLTKRQN